MKLTIDGHEIEAEVGQSVLDAALAAGIFIPHLCKHPDLGAVGGCRLCMIEIAGQEGAVCACKTAVADGMVVDSHGEEAERVRRMAMELILATHPTDCTGCPKYGKCELQSMYQFMGVAPTRWRVKSRPCATNDSNPLITHMMTRCIRCGRCIRACRDMRGVSILDYRRGTDGVRVGTKDGLPLAESGCRFCGACVEVCPTGSIVDSLGLIKQDKPYADGVVPCRANCPAHIDIPRYIRHVKHEDWTAATAVVREKVPLPNSLGHICTHFCEGACKRTDLGGPVSICRLKRAAAEQDSGAWKERVRLESRSGKRVAVIGSGPAGLTAAQYLAKKGHAVTIFEANAQSGGQMRYGIPAYRLPDSVVDTEVETILSTTSDEQGARIEIIYNQQVEDVKGLLNDFDSVLVAVGTHAGVRLRMPGSDLKGVYLNTEFLKAARSEQPLPVDGKVVVLGGGNVAYDCARTAVRLGAQEVHVACLEARAAMTSTPEERIEAAAEGVELHDSCAFYSINPSKKQWSHVGSVTLNKISRFYFDENHKAVTEFVENGEITLDADYVIFAVGQRPAQTENFGLELFHGAFIVADAEGKTPTEGIWSAGDCVTGTKSVIEAIAAGRRAAESMDVYLGGDGDISEVLTDADVYQAKLGPVDEVFVAERNEPELMEANKRAHTMEPFECSFTSEGAVKEASRCLQCDLRLHIDTPKLWNEYAVH
ncbi:FAD-dependent oxidoreductase [Collinsella sp. zg1085]|uniref:FAD-dependent oxidoreductase n=1 Tax=Collinsella sp. zg1085 TaxID=2844380 RepID=UPI001C0B642F|nr:FAD-dependent oxidoreductase [Collinsella sp. zg1085]QWT17682.1 FAD-dependent oxidoreductase [Collinsella sp. zg1085]